MAPNSSGDGKERKRPSESSASSASSRFTHFSAHNSTGSISEIPDDLPSDGSGSSEPSSSREGASTKGRIHPVYSAPPPALRFVNITDPKQTKTQKFKTDVRSQAMTSHMWRKRTKPQGVTKREPRPPETVVKQIARPLPRAKPGTRIVWKGGKVWVESDGELHELVVMKPITPELPGYHNDPFGIMPKMEDPSINIPHLVHHGRRMYSTDYVDVLSFKIEDSNPLIFIPNLMVTSEYLDLLNGQYEDSKVTTALKTKSLQLMNEHVRNASSVNDDLTIMTVTKLLSAEQVIYGDAVDVHQNALHRIVEGRGGLKKLRETSFMGAYVTSVVFWHHIVHEIQPSDEWYDFAPHKYRLATSMLSEDKTVVGIMNFDASIYAPHLKRGKGLGFLGQLVETSADPSGLVELLPIRKSDYFSAQSQAILLNLRLSINLFLDLDVAAEDDSADQQTREMANREALKAVLLHTQLLPSAANNSPDNPVANDWQFECCRLASLVLFTSMYLKVPFSQANQLLATRYSSPLPTTAFVAALLRTDYNNCWGEMSAILTLFIMIMTAASAGVKKSGIQHDLRARKWLMVSWMRSCLTLAFEPGWAFNSLLRIILEVQKRLIPEYDTA